MNNRRSQLASKSEVLAWEGQTYTGSSVGFGRMWLRTYHLIFSEDGLTPEHVILDWRENFFEYWPEGSKPVEARLPIETGEVYTIRIATPFGLSLETGFVVISVTQDSFTLMTRSDHPFSGWIHFSAEVSAGGVLVQTQALVRPRDPLWEIAFRLGILPRAEDAFWKYVLCQISERYSTPSDVHIRSSLLDPQVQWQHVDQVLGNRPARYGVALIAAIAFTYLARRFGKLQQSYLGNHKK